MKFNKLRKIGLICAVSASALLSGCASTLGIGSPDYGCSGLPEGVQCMSAREVYGMTEQPGPVRADPNSIEEDGGAADRAAKESLLGRMGGAERQGSPVSEWSHPDVQNPHPMASSALNADPMPIRTRAKIMRIWVAPWESTNGDLNISGMVFTELDQRRWNIGTKESEASPTLTPLQTRVVPKPNE